MAARRPIAELAPTDVINQLRLTIQQEHAQNQFTEADMEKELRTRLDALHVETFHRTAKETTRRWTYEQEIKRPYYHVTDLDEAQLTNWRKYLTFEEAEGEHVRIKLLYERCLVTTANYDEFWFRYARWMYGQSHLSKEVRNEEMRNIFLRASCIFVSISRPEIRLQYARFEESLGNAATAIDIHESILATHPHHLETIISLTNVHRRAHGVDAALKTLDTLNVATLSPEARGALTAESARLTWKVQGDTAAARQIFESSKDQHPSSQQFWLRYFDFELEQPASAATEAEAYPRIKAVYDDIRQRASLPEELLAGIAAKYFAYLSQRGAGPAAMEEYLDVDMQIHGSKVGKAAAEEGQGAGGVAQQNGHGHVPQEAHVAVPAKALAVAGQGKFHLQQAYQAAAS